jgi:hypothetical protein
MESRVLHRPVAIYTAATVLGLTAVYGLASGINLEMRRPFIPAPAHTTPNAAAPSMVANTEEPAEPLAAPAAAAPSDLRTHPRVARQPPEALAQATPATSLATDAAADAPEDQAPPAVQRADAPKPGPDEEPNTLAAPAPSFDPGADGEPVERDDSH